MKIKTKLKFTVLVVTFSPLALLTYCFLFFDSDYLKEVIPIVMMTIFCLDLSVFYWLYGSIIKPLKQLRAATKKIKNGNLDFKLETGNADEFGELCRDFDDMRVRLKETSEEIIRNDQKTKELISNISHDLKTPITAIKGYVEGIMDGVANTPDKQQRYIKTIYTKANDMERLIGELTMFSQLDSNRVPYNFAKVNLAEFFSDCAEELNIELDSKNIKLTYQNFTDHSIVIIADVEQLRRVINNVISNSLKYMDKEHGEIKIYILEEGDFVHIQMEDNGKGIETKNIPYIFDRFYRTDSSRNSSTGGSGIGLSIVKAIIQAHGGQVWATSQLGVGTTIHFVIRKYIEVLQDEVQDEKKEEEKKDRKKKWIK